MKNKNTLLGGLEKLFSSFGLTATIYLIMTLLFGEEGNGETPMFALGSQGLSTEPLLQLFGLCVICVFWRYFFLSDLILHKAGRVFRTAGVTAAVLSTAILFIFLFDWFPTDSPYAWIGFLVSTVLSTLVSFLISRRKDRMENQAMAEALRRMREKDDE